MTDRVFLAGLSQRRAYALADAVAEAEGLAFSASAYEASTPEEWVFEAICGDTPDLSALVSIATPLLGYEPVFSVQSLDAGVNWVARSLEGLPPVRAGRFCVFGSHAAPLAEAGLTGIRIDAAQAFGTGHHETTAGCLEAIEIVLKRMQPTRMLDVGSGTGLLAIALAKRTRRRVLASDIDPVAVETARQNSRENGVGHLVEALEARGLDHRRILGASPFDLIVANILAGPLIALAPAMGRAVAPRAAVILSGILALQARRVLNAYAMQGMVPRSIVQRGDWTTLILEKR